MSIDGNGQSFDSLDPNFAHDLDTFLIRFNKNNLLFPQNNSFTVLYWNVMDFIFGNIDFMIIFNFVIYWHILFLFGEMFLKGFWEI